MNLKAPIPCQAKPIKIELHQLDEDSIFKLPELKTKPYKGSCRTTKPQQGSSFQCQLLNSAASCLEALKKSDPRILYSIKYFSRAKAHDFTR